MVDVVTVMHAIVLPAVEAVFREGEVTAVELHADRGSVLLRLRVEGETYPDAVVQAGVPGQSVADWRERLRSNLVDVVAESAFGWGTNRGTKSP